MSSEYRPTEYHAGLEWDMKETGKVIIPPGTEYPPTEYHARLKWEKEKTGKK